ncbi:hypothetical protein HPP92_016632 [Vanilla planifolia]|uniref:Lon N-terminal domain-containing protein n=1 Tax=Vanilla planifolia TaxID=51239 RepID=A0A835QF49_VANPL|nr:hypothetical protein HPP92_016632 [Vanilla planifolia]
MLKILSSSCFQGRVHSLHTRFWAGSINGGLDRSPLLRLLGCLSGPSGGVAPVPRKALCSDSGEGGGGGGSIENSVEAKAAEEAEYPSVGAEEGKASSAIVATNPRPEDHLSVIAVPLPHRPLFPGFYMPVSIKDSKLLSALAENCKRSVTYAGKELLKRLHDVGTLAQISSIQGNEVYLLGHRRLRITEMVDEDPLTVKVDHLKENPYNKDDDVIKATYFEVISTLRDVLKISSIWREYAKTYSRFIGEFTYGRLADFGAALSMANKLLCQQVLEELDVHRRLKLTLELIKKEIEITKIQESIAKAIEEKISGEQRRYLLNEQLKAIKKVIDEELTKLQLLEASSSEFNVTRNYLDWLTALPWGDYSDENFDVHRAQEILDEDHYGLSDVKERILEFIAVGKLRGTSHGFQWEAWPMLLKIKGHRRTYIGAMPGKMVQCLKNVGTANPLVLIDEIDKLGRGHAGDPASALLELLDPEQNMNFLDHYLDIPIDLSKAALSAINYIR